MKPMSQRVSHAAWLPHTSKPPHDPKRLALNKRSGWRLAWSENIIGDTCGNLSLDIKPEAMRLLSESAGAFGGLSLAKHLAYTPDGGLLLLDKANSLLKKFDPCECKFLTVPCTGGIGSAAREFSQPQAISICGDNLLVADRDNHRLVVYSLLGFLLRGSWQVPEDKVNFKWQPVDVRVSQDRKVLVADPANGCVHIFNFAGCWLRCLSGVGAVSSIAVDKLNRLYVATGDGLPVTVFDLHKKEKLFQLDATSLTNTAWLLDAFCPPDMDVNAAGWVNLGGLCARYKGSQHVEAHWFDNSGQAVAEPEVTINKYLPSGVLYSDPIDSQIYRCQWDRIAMELDVPQGTRIKISTFSAESPLSDKQVRNLPEDLWQTQQWVLHDKSQPLHDLWDCLIRSEGGRLLWLKIEMLSDGLATPRICNVELNFPRISLARYLPAVFSEEPGAADFSNRFLGIFDRGFRQVESHVDSFAQYLDPLSAPAQAGKKDFLSWLASWIGITLDRQLPLTIRRNLVKNAAGLFKCRGTLVGLRSMLDLYLGFSKKSCTDNKSAAKNYQAICGHCSTKPQADWQAPEIILEHFKLRRWLFVGAGRLGEQARLWGKKIVNRTQLNGQQIDGNAQLGVSELNTRQDPLRDPFHVYAHKFSIFLPAWVSRTGFYSRAIEKLIAAEKPANTEHSIVYVEPRFRVGIQSMIGFDSVIGCYPQGVTLGEAELGKATVLSSADKNETGVIVGSNSTIGTTTRLK